MYESVFQPGQEKKDFGWWTCGHVNDQIQLMITKITDLNGNLITGAGGGNQSRRNGNGSISNPAPRDTQSVDFSQEITERQLKQLQAFQQKVNSGNANLNDAEAAKRLSEDILKQLQSQQ